MANFLHHAPCPHCGSRDNLGVYDDGSTFCFGCRASSAGNLQSRINNRKDALWKTGDNGSEGHLCYLPSDVDSGIPTECCNWISKFGLDKYDLLRSRALWSGSRQLLIFPYWGSGGTLTAWQGRYFGQSPDHPKWTGQGRVQNVRNTYGKRSDEIVLVEDVLSAIKIGKVGHSMPIFGSVIRTDRLFYLKKQGYVKLYFWLDKDKARESLTRLQQAATIGFKIQLIVTKEDPKLLTLDNIKGELNYT